MCNAHKDKCKKINNRRNREQIKKESPREKGNYKYLAILEADTIKQAEMKEKMTKEYLRKTTPSSATERINTWAVPLVR